MGPSTSPAASPRPLARRNGVKEQRKRRPRTQPFRRRADPSKDGLLSSSPSLPSVAGTTAEDSTARRALRAANAAYLVLLPAAALAVVLSAMVAHDLGSDDVGDDICSLRYIWQAGVPLPSSSLGRLTGTEGRGHQDCRMLLAAGGVGTTAGAISLALMLVGSVPVCLARRRPGQEQLKPNPLFLRPQSQPSVLLTHAFFSLLSVPLYLTAALLYSTSKAVTFYPYAPKSRRFYLFGAIAACWLAVIVSALQATLVVWSFCRLWIKRTPLVLDERRGSETSIEEGDGAGTLESSNAEKALGRGLAGPEATV